MRIWTLVLALMVATLVADVAMAGHRRCGGRRHRPRCGHTATQCGGGHCAVAPCAGGHCDAGVGHAAGYAAQGGYGYGYADWTYGYPGVGYTGYPLGLIGYRQGAFYGGAR